MLDVKQPTLLSNSGVLGSCLDVSQMVKHRPVFELLQSDAHDQCIFEHEVIRCHVAFDQVCEDACLGSRNAHLIATSVYDMQCTC